MHILYTNIGSRLANNQLIEYINTLPDNIRDRIRNYRRWQDLQASVFGYLLLREGLRYFGSLKLGLTDVKYSNFNRPYFSDSIDFNISHSGCYVAFVIAANCHVGIDIEEVKDIELNKLHRCWDLNDYQYAARDENPHAAFYDLWTKKEAVAKASGEGLSLDPITIKLCNNVAQTPIGKAWYIKEIPLDSAYKANIAASTLIKGSPRMTFINLHPSKQTG